MSLVGAAALEGGIGTRRRLCSGGAYRFLARTRMQDIDYVLAGGLIVPEISIDPKQSMLRFSYFTWNRNVYPLLYVYLVPDEPSCGIVVTQNDRVKSILSDFWDIMVNPYAKM